MKELSFHQAQSDVDVLVKEFGGYWPPFAMLASVMEEVGELAREINSLEKVKVKKPTEKAKPIDEEIADSLFSLICIANYYKVDLGTALEKVLKKYRLRDQGRFTEPTK